MMSRLYSEVEYALRGIVSMGWLVLILCSCADSRVPALAWHGDLDFAEKTTAAVHQVVDAWDRADLNTVRFSADLFPGLPPGVVADLNREGCRIPQSWHAVEPENVVSGRFTNSGQMDIAVLCSVKRTLSSRIYREGSTTDISVVNPVPDRAYLQDVGGGEIGYSRAIDVAGPDYIRDQHTVLGGPASPFGSRRDH